GQRGSVHFARGPPGRGSGMRFHGRNGAGGPKPETPRVAGAMAVKISTEWVPIRIYWQSNQPMVDWAFLGERRFTDPFFIQTINPCVRHPADVLFRHQTPLEALGEIAASRPAV